MHPVDDIVTQNTPGLKIWDENWGGMQCAYHIFAPGTDFTQILAGKGLAHDLCGVEHWAYVLKGSLKVIYLDGTVEICRAGEACYWPAPHNFNSKEGAEIIQFSTAGGLAAQAKIIQEYCRETDEEVSVDDGAGPARTGRPRHRRCTAPCAPGGNGSAPRSTRRSRGQPSGR